MERSSELTRGEPTSTRQLRPIVPPHEFQPQQNYQVRQPPAFTNSNVIGSSSDDLYEMMKTLAFNIITLQ